MAVPKRVSVHPVAAVGVPHPAASHRRRPGSRLTPRRSRQRGRYMCFHWGFVNEVYKCSTHSLDES